MLHLFLFQPLVFEELPFFPLSPTHYQQTNFIPMFHFHNWLPSNTKQKIFLTIILSRSKVSSSVACPNFYQPFFLARKVHLIGFLTAPRRCSADNILFAEVCADLEKSHLNSSTKCQGLSQQALAFRTVTLPNLYQNYSTEVNQTAQMLQM